jgi:predicted O-methyltransferase YrrM
MNWRVLLEHGEDNINFFNFPEMYSGIQWWCAAASKITGAMAAMICVCIQARTAIEIGVANGFSTECLCRGLAMVGREGAFLISCDETELSSHLATNFANRYKIPHKTIQGLSQDVNWADHLEGRLCDVAFIDGDHRYPGAIHDMLAVQEVISPTGVMICHDYHHAQPGVVQACQEMVDEQGWKMWTFPELPETIDYGWAILHR